jgi:hypothetical protein
MVGQNKFSPSSFDAAKNVARRKHTLVFKLEFNEEGKSDISF